MEAREKAEISRTVNRWARYKLIVMVEMCYVGDARCPGRTAVSSDCWTSGRAAAIITTNLPFSEWTTMVPNAQLCRAMVDRLTDRRAFSGPEMSRTGSADLWPRVKERKHEQRWARTVVSSMPTMGGSRGRPRTDSMAGRGAYLPEPGPSKCSGEALRIGLRRKVPRSRPAGRCKSAWRSVAPAELRHREE